MGYTRKKKEESDEGTPLIPNFSFLASLPEVDQNEDVYIIRPIYQKGKIVACLKEVMLSPKKNNRQGWGVWAAMWEPQYKYVERVKLD